MTVLAPRLLTAAQGGAAIVPSATELPSDWGITRLAGNPVIDVDNNPNGGTEQYAPGPVLLPNGDIWVYVKGSGAAGNEVFAWKSIDGGETFTLEGGQEPVLSVVASTWESARVTEPACAVLDGSTIHLYYKGRQTSTATWAWGHATAPITTPDVLTKDPTNPILTSADVIADIGGTQLNNDNSVNDVVIVNGVWYFYGYVRHDSVYKLVMATGSTWNDPDNVTVLLTATDVGFETIQSPTVFRLPGPTRLYCMLWNVGEENGNINDPRYIRSGTSPDLINWTFQSANIMAPVAATWESTWTYAPSMLKALGQTVWPHVDDQGRWMLYYSGYDQADANVGLAYLEPTF